MVRTALLTGLLTLILTTVHFAFSPSESTANAAKVREHAQAGQMTPNRRSDMPAHLPPRPNDADISALVTSSDTMIRVAHAPQTTEMCAEEWRKDVSHQSWRCIDGMWHQINFEQWSCKQPQQVVDHTHQQRTEDACSTS